MKLKRLALALCLFCAYSANIYSQACDGSLTVTVEGSATGTPLTVSNDVTSDYNGEDVSCNGASDGEATATPAGGSTPFTYLWDAAAGAQTTQTATGLAAGTYSVTVTDVNGCMATNTVTITEPTVVTAVADVTSDYNGEDISCNAATDGEATATPGGGVAPYTYQWDAAAASQTTKTATSLAAGTYTVTITDANGCEETAMVTLTEPTVVTAVADVTSDFNGEDISCNAATDGEATATPGGGVAPYTYQWDAAAASQTTQTATGLAAGTYTVTITDANGCEETAMVTLTEPTVVTAVADVTSDYNGEEISCNGATDGEATATPGGGVAPYTYQWDAAAASQTTQTATGLAAGTYTVAITDANGCEETAMVTLTEPTVVTAVADVTSDYNGEDISCNGATDGEATATPGGGVAPYTYQWDAAAASQTTQTATGLAAGTYTVTITDANGCEETAMVTLTEPTSFTCSTSSPIVGNAGTNLSCNGDSDGTATASPIGGTAPFTYLWDAAAAGQTTATATNLAAGTYEVTVTDANGCFTVCDVTLTEPDQMVAGTCTVADFCQVGEGEIEVELTSGGVSPYTVTWTSSNGGSLNEVSQTINNAGDSVVFTGAQVGNNFSFVITDFNGCIIQ